MKELSRRASRAESAYGVTMAVIIIDHRVLARLAAAKYEGDETEKKAAR